VSDPAPPSQLPDEPYDERGVDRSLVRWMLSLTPTERLGALQSYLEQLAEFRIVDARRPPG
jgi:hypothetical protein